MHPTNSRSPIRRSPRAAGVLLATALLLAACGGGDEAGGAEDASATAALEARIEELEAQLDASDGDGVEEADAAPAPATAVTPSTPAPATTAPAPAAPAPLDQAPEPEPEPEPEVEPEAEPEPEPEAEVEEAVEEAVDPVTIEMHSQRRNGGTFIVVVRARSDLGGSAWGITDVLMERPNEYNALMDEDARWLGPQTGERDQWTASLNCDRQGKYKDWLFVTATDEEGRTARVRFDVTAAC